MPQTPTSSSLSEISELAAAIASADDTNARLLNRLKERATRFSPQPRVPAAPPPRVPQPRVQAPIDFESFVAAISADSPAASPRPPGSVPAAVESLFQAVSELGDDQACIVDDLLDVVAVVRAAMASERNTHEQWRLESAKLRTGTMERVRAIVRERDDARKVVTDLEARNAALELEQERRAASHAAEVRRLRLLAEQAEERCASMQAELVSSHEALAEARAVGGVLQTISESRASLRRGVFPGNGETEAGSTASAVSQLSAQTRQQQALLDVVGRHREALRRENSGLRAELELAYRSSASPTSTLH